MSTKVLTGPGFFEYSEMQIAIMLEYAALFPNLAPPVVNDHLASYSVGESGDFTDLNGLGVINVTTGVCLEIKAKWLK